MKKNLKQQVIDLLNGSDDKPKVFMYKENILFEQVNNEWVQTEKEPGTDDIIVTAYDHVVNYNNKIIILRGPTPELMIWHWRRCGMTEADIQKRFTTEYPLEKYADILVKLKNP